MDRTEVYADNLIDSNCTALVCVSHLITSPCLQLETYQEFVCPTNDVVPVKKTVGIMGTSLPIGVIVFNRVTGYPPARSQILYVKNGYN